MALPPRRPGPPAPKAPTLPYRKLEEGRDYWILENALPNAKEVSERLYARPEEAWTWGLPKRAEMWPGMRSPNALTPEELEPIEAWVLKMTQAKRLWQPPSPDPSNADLSHNNAQLVGAADSGPRPHTDSRRLAQFAGVLYLTPRPLPRSGTSFYRLRMPNGALSGNFCPSNCYNLTEALGQPKMPLDAWHEDLVIANAFNRLIVYRADLVHSATGYFGKEHREKRLTGLFFWRAD